MDLIGITSYSLRQLIANSQARKRGEEKGVEDPTDSHSDGKKKPVHPVSRFFIQLFIHK